MLGFFCHGGHGARAHGGHGGPSGPGGVRVVADPDFWEMKNAPRDPAMASESPEPPRPPAQSSVNSVSPNAPAAPPRVCVSLAELVTRAGGRRLGADARGEPVEYALPAHATVEVREYLRPLASVTAPPGGLAWLPSARVFGAGVVLSADGSLLARDVSEDFGKGSDEHWLLGFDGLRAPEALDGPVAAVAVNRGANYCHWLLEELPRLLALGIGAADTIVAHAAAPFALAALALRGGPETVRPARRASHFECSPLLVPGLVTRAGEPTPEALRRVREFAGPLGRGALAGGAGERVYFSRARAARRRVANEDALWAGLAAERFSRVFLEELDWEAQIAVARAARVVVAPHGAGLANLVFCAPGTRVLELVNRDHFPPLFWRLAALAGLDYRPVVAPGDGELAASLPANKRDIGVDVGAVRRALAGNG